ncbi:MAG: RibD family protein, partial [Gammaproteobacteria bacterium]|nr:RibD family protein [Gammaproteobacteria bacterium]MDX2462074.1 RibD family protein [Gammaproteobacteria bacterium]
LRVVLDRRLRTPPQASLLSQPGATLIATRSDQRDARQALMDKGAEILSLSDSDNELATLMTALAERGINEVLVEAGATLSGALLDAQLVDEIVLYVAPILLGDAARGLFHLPQVQTLSQALALDVIDITPLANDWRITALPRQQT